MPATLYPYPSGPDASGLCSWHWEHHAGHADTWEAFIAWLAIEQERKACSNWTHHHDAEILWRWTRGESGESAETPCRRAGCIVRATAERALPRLPVCSEAETRRLVANLTETLSRIGLPGPRPLPAPVRPEQGVDNDF